MLYISNQLHSQRCVDYHSVKSPKQAICTSASACLRQHASDSSLSSVSDSVMQPCCPIDWMVPFNRSISFVRCKFDVPARR